MPKKQIDPGPFVIPMPTVLIGAQVDGKPNFMTAAFAAIVNMSPPTVVCSLNPSHHTCKGMVENKTFSINIPSADIVEATDWCGLVSGAKVDKSKTFDVFYGETKTAPMIEACRLTVECKLFREVELKVDTVYFGEIVSVHVDEDALVDGKPDWKKIAPLIFTFPDKGYWNLGECVAEAWSVGKGFKSS
jgi:flavin reductase (DIM6/NTAB) family NADH-FMN oxidoreductase RutF